MPAYLLWTAALRSAARKDETIAACSAASSRYLKKLMPVSRTAQSRYGCSCSVGSGLGNGVVKTNAAVPEREVEFVDVRLVSCIRVLGAAVDKSRAGADENRGGGVEDGGEGVEDSSAVVIAVVDGKGPGEVVIISRQAEPSPPQTPQTSSTAPSQAGAGVGASGRGGGRCGRGGGHGGASQVDSPVFAFQ
jgi:hypothetical protein